MTNRLDGMKLPSSTEYASYVLGINDEGQYFAHEIEDVPRSVKNMSQLLNWMNRVDEGYTHRVQGDILLQFVGYEHAPKSDAEVLTSGPVAGLEFYVNEDSTALLSRRIGNHEIITPTDGFARERWTQQGQVWIVSGRQFVMLHPQHATRTVNIPKGMVAVLNAQRGRADQRMAD